MFLRIIILIGLSHHLGSPEWYWIAFFYFVLSIASFSFNPTFSLSLLHESFHSVSCPPQFFSVSSGTGASYIRLSTCPFPFLLSCPYQLFHWLNLLSLVLFEYSENMSGTPNGRQVLRRTRVILPRSQLNTCSRCSATRYHSLTWMCGAGWYVQQFILNWPSLIWERSHSHRIAIEKLKNNRLLNR